MSIRPHIATGLPPNTKQVPRPDFRPQEFERLYETKGLRAWWSRALPCPCEYNAQTDQSDPTCSLCKNHPGWLFELPESDVDGGGVDAHGNAMVLNVRGDAVQIRVIVTSITADPQVHERFGEWVFGTVRISSRAYNRIGYRDRIELVDATMAWHQFIEGDGAQTIAVRAGVGKLARTGLRYPVARPISLRSLAQRFKANVDYEVTPTGEIRWLATPPAAGTKLSLACEIHPVFRVLDHVYAVRASQRTENQVHMDLPVAAVARLDYLVGNLP